MKKLICALIALSMLVCPALAEAGAAATPAATPGAIQIVTPTPSPEPAGEHFSSEDLAVTLPHGMRILESDALAGFEAAVQSDYPGAARTVLLAANEDASAVLLFAVAEGSATPLAAATEAATAILGSDSGVSEMSFGENASAGFACAVGEQVYRLYYFSNGSSLLIVGASGLEKDAIAETLSGLDF